MRFPDRNITSSYSRTMRQFITSSTNISRYNIFFRQVWVKPHGRFQWLIVKGVERMTYYRFLLGEKRMHDGEEVVDDAHRMNKHRFIFSPSIKSQREIVLFRDRVTFHSSDISRNSIFQECLFFASK